MSERESMMKHFSFILMFSSFLSISWAGAGPQSCLFCHNSANSLVPNISGQNRSYLEKQLFDYKYKNRLNQKMYEVAKGLTTEEIQKISEYFARSSWVNSAKIEADVIEVARGRELANQIGCASCHGEKLQGLIRAPRISGQKFNYLQSQLKAFHFQQRTNDFGQMFSVTQFLSDEDIRYLALFLNSL